MRPDLGRREIEGKRWVEARKGESRRETDRAVREGELLAHSTCYFCKRDRTLHKHHVSYINPHYILWVCQSCHHGIHYREKDARLSHLAAKVGSELKEELRCRT